MVESVCRPDQFISIVEERGRLCPYPHPHTAIGVTMATAIFLERVSDAWEQLGVSRRPATPPRSTQHHVP
jgi:hypothetical protein